ncbi:hypothetical protein PV08_02278 [Exophiala spinifera]|uniref:Xylanolytic transcriptional activator regulatory domain-containing protein n=1 Tax=Exophiala spinifera TaxID=91928 RepID=A0A0D1ZZA1_9EURO|nr:uncharacterized protein PV08_02278 [Exophiala spinifera]KIW17992.1 hypothetical protein PV08_02278 [Exophiala spinifera]
MPKLSQDRPSTSPIKLFRGLDTEGGILTDSDAIPDATPDQLSSTTIREKVIPVSELIECDLPAREATMMLFTTFIDSVHWFMMVFHEPTLRVELDNVLRTGSIGEHRLSTLILILVILLIATKYTREEEASLFLRAGVNLQLLQSRLLRIVEWKFLAVLDQDDIGALQVCVLLSSFYFYHGSPNRCLAMNSAAIRIAQKMKIHQESDWPSHIDKVEREVRRRVWWALYVVDGYGAMTYGTTNILQSTKCQVNLPENIDDTLDSCPGFNSCEQTADGSSCAVTTLSYQRFKFRLYRIAEPIMGEIYFHNGQPVHTLVKRVQQINQQLLEWEASVPPELRPKLLVSSGHQTDKRTNPVTKIFQLQALALQLSYDNIQLILHRPLLVYNGVLLLGPRPNTAQPLREAHLDQDANFWGVSKDLCWKSALRTACIDEYPSILKQVRNFHAASYAGIQTFTAGVMLGIFALSKPFSSQAQEAKRAIGRLIKTPKLLGYQTTISDQTGRILERLLRLVLGEELKLLTSDESTPSTGIAQPNSQALRHSGADTSRSNTQETFHHDGNTLGDSLDIFGTSTIMEDYCQSATSNSNSLPKSVCHPDYQPQAGQSNDGAIETQELNSRLDDSNDPANMDLCRIGENLEMPWSISDPAANGASFFDSSFLGDLGDLGQAWMWDESFQFS